MNKKELRWKIYDNLAAHIRSNAQAWADDWGKTPHQKDKILAEADVIQAALAGGAITLRTKRGASDEG